MHQRCSHLTEYVPLPRSGRHRQTGHPQAENTDHSINEACQYCAPELRKMPEDALRAKQVTERLLIPGVEGLLPAAVLGLVKSVGPIAVQ